MPKLFNTDQLIWQIAVIALLWLGACTASGQTPPPTPAIDPAIATDPAAEPAATAESSAASSALPEKPPEKPMYGSATERDNALLANAQPDEVLWLDTPNEKIVSRYKPAETRKAKGALLILHAPEIPQLWPASLENLRRNLPVYGWDTLAVPLPQKYLAATPERDLTSSAASSASAATSADAESSSADSSISPTSAADVGESSSSAAPSSSSSSEAAKPRIPRAQLINERVAAAIQALNKKGQFNIVVLVDNSGAPDSLAGLFTSINLNNGDQTTIDGPLQALVLLNLQGQEPLTRQQLSNIFSVELLPVMDVFFGSDDQAQIDHRRLHRGEAMRKNVRHYQQVVLPPESVMMNKNTQGFWLEKVRGFMETKAEGKEIKFKK